MTLSLSSACLAIALAGQRGTLTLTERTDRWGDAFIAIGDEYGTIEIAAGRDAAQARVNELRSCAAA